MPNLSSKPADEDPTGTSEASVKYDIIIPESWSPDISRLSQVIGYESRLRNERYITYINFLINSELTFFDIVPVL